jgi:hypothetical protein
VSQLSIRAPGEVDALSSQHASDGHTLDRIAANFRAREPAPYLTEEEGRWLLERAEEWKATHDHPDSDVVSVTCPTCDEHFEWGGR